jgi:hypothetical protein
VGTADGAERTRYAVRRGGGARELGQCVLHGCGGLVPHTRHHVAVGAQGNRYRGVSQELLDELRMDALREQQRGTRMPQVVKADLWQLRA